MFFPLSNLKKNISNVEKERERKSVIEFLDEDSTNYITLVELNVRNLQGRRVASIKRKKTQSKGITDFNEVQREQDGS